MRNFFTNLLKKNQEWGKLFFNRIINIPKKYLDKIIKKKSDFDYDSLVTSAEPPPLEENTKSKKLNFDQLPDSSLPSFPIDTESDEEFDQATISKVDHYKTKLINYLVRFPKLQKLVQKINLPKKFSLSSAASPAVIEKINLIFEPRHRNDFHRFYILTLVLTICFFIGKLSGLIIKPTKQFANLTSGTIKELDTKRNLLSTDLIALRNLKMFKTEKVSIDPNKNNNQPEVPLFCEVAKINSNLPIKVLNTIVMQDRLKSVVSVQGRSGGGINSYREGETINGQARIDYIQRMQIVVKNIQSNQCENLFGDRKLLEPLAGINVLSPNASKAFLQNQKKIEGIVNDGNKFEIKKNLIKEKMTNISEILTQARGIPITNPDGSMAFKIVDIEPGSIYTYLGIQDGDIITSINGQKISDLNEVMGLFAKIGELDNLQLTLNRGGVDTPLDYSFK
jgi:type II secretion system protein C